MKNLVASLAIALVGGAACSSSSGGGAVSQQLCALASACSGATGGAFIGLGFLCENIQADAALLPNLGGPDATLFGSELTCLKSATDCPSFQACLTVPDTTAAKCEQSTTLCADGYLVDCKLLVGGKPQGQNCGADGLVCEQDAEGAACGTAKCDESTKPTCNGDDIIRCQPGGALTSTSCKYTVATQEVDGAAQTQVSDTCAIVGGTAMCVGTGAACDQASTKNSCDGTSIVSCTGGKLARFDCSVESPSATCAIQTDGSALCAGAGKECTTNTPETCVDGVITYCLWGTTTTADCKSFGLSGCTTESVQGVAAAGCVP